jgi:uncharacterized protein
MHKQIFVNLAVKDVQRSINFFESLGYEFNPQFTNDQAAALILGENLFAMLLDEKFFTTFTPKILIDAKTHIETLVALPLDSREAVEALIAKAKRAGATTPTEPKDHGFMYQHAYTDLDGHVWEVFYMDMTQFPGANA